MNCPVCGHEKINVKYYKPGDLVTSSSFIDMNNEFLESSEFTYYFRVRAKKEHISIKCPECNYSALRPIE